MKMEHLPKVFAAAFIVIFFMFFQNGTAASRAASLVGELFRNKSSSHLGMRRELPQTSLQAAVPAYRAAFMPRLETEVPTLRQSPTPTPLPTLIPESISVFDNPEFYKFVQQETDGETGVERGIFVPGILSNPIIQQPNNNWSYVSEDPDNITEFQSAHSNQVTGLLAHNFLIGAKFYDIQIGQYLAIVYGDGSVKRYQVTGIFQFEKLNLSSLTSDFIDLQTKKQVSSTEIFNRFYTGSDKVTLQTCLERGGQPSWGLTFIVAEPTS
jgi:hypothetical protein